MGDQEEERLCNSMLHLSTAAAVSPRTTTSVATHNHSTKRHSASSPFQEPLHKRPSLHPPSSPAKKLPFPTRSPAPLECTVSAPVPPPVAACVPVGTGDSPSSKRMTEMLRRMSELWDQLLSEEDYDEDGEAQTQIDLRLDDHTYSPGGDAIPVPKMLNDDGVEYEEGIPATEESQEAIWVEKIGEYLALHFKCPCGKGYKVLLSGDNFYYKLTHF